MNKRLLCVAGLATVLAASVHAASFDCAKAARPAEKLICSDPRLNAADEDMGQRYRASLARLPSSAVGLLRVDQVQWLAWMQEICHVPLPDEKSLSESSRTGVIQCMLPLYFARTKQLRASVTERDGVHFLVRTQFLAAPEQAAPSGSPEFPGFGTLQASWPIALASLPEWQAWNRATEAEAYSMATDGTPPEAASALQPAQWTADLAEDADTQVSVLAPTVEHGRASAYASTYTMGHGAAHPAEASENMTWLLQPQRRLRADDVFQPGGAWKKVLTQACWSNIHTREQRTTLYPQVNGPDAKPLQEVVQNVGNWWLAHDGLHISYPPYAVAPRSAQIEDTVVPWTTLQPVLLKGFTAP